jgi:DNA-binding transcriptional MerR regulator
MADQDRYNKKELAAMFGKTVRTIDRWWKSGRIPKPKKIVGQRYWDREQVEKAKEMVVGQ